MDLFVFFALPFATILLAIVLQKILRSPILVAITFFAVGLIVSFSAFSDVLAEALIATIIYTLIAFITAYIVMLICRCRRRFCGNSNNNVGLQNQIFQAERILPTQTIASQRRCLCGENNCGNDDNNDNENGNDSENNNLLRISCRCGNSDQSSDLLTVDSTCFANNLDNNEETEAVNSQTDLSGTTMIAGNQIGNNARYSNCGNTMTNRNYMQRRVYRRW